MEFEVAVAFEHELAIGSISFRIESGHLKVGDLVVRLTTTEAKVMAVLYRQRGQWVSHEVIREGVTSGSAIYDSSLVRVHLHNIRKRLGAFAWIVHTERNRGSMLRIV